MKQNRFAIPQSTFDEQARAADPKNSVWVSANAGSGKTHVLSRRVIRLLLDGADPSRILCLTYTRAAAANMANKVFEDLASWSTMDDGALAKTISALEGRPPDDKRLRHARQLFARALETPGGLKIQTIHAFCEAVLHQFPLEANIAGHFELLDGSMEAALIAEARRDLITGASSRDQPELGRAFADILDIAGETGLDALLSEIVNKRDGLRSFLQELGGGENAKAALAEEFDLDPDDTAEKIAASLWPDNYFDRALADTMAARAAQAGKSTAAAFAANLIEAAAEVDPVDRLEPLSRAFLLATRTQVRKPGPIAAKGVEEHFNDLAVEIDRFGNRLLAVLDRIARLRMVDATGAALVVADVLIARYERLKTGRGFLDFNDLITRTVNLLAREDAGPWVQYKLDRGLDHILIDEAQDTSPGQWQVVRRLAEEFFAGSGARADTNRTIFAVGDEKQSIYSFQGAEPAEFAESGRAFERTVTAAERRFEQVRLKHSFRSVSDVLSAVDRVFQADEARKGLTVYPEPIDHSAIRANDPGYVEVWPMIGAEKVSEPEDWTQAVDHASAPAVRLAEIIAERVAGWIENGERIEGTGQRLRPRDVLVLVRKRDSFIHALSRSLKTRQIAVAGVDRLRLYGHIAIKDLAALGRFALQPDDDLSLAALLKSPIFGLDDDDLFAFCHGRGKEMTLWQSLRNNRDRDAGAEHIVHRLEQWRSEAGFRPVTEFYSAILGRDGVRAAMISRLGPEAGEILDEFVNFAIVCERTGITGLGAFLETLERTGQDIKREISQTRDEVRIMTVHAAKGLEAPVVFLVDSGGAPASKNHLPRLMPFASENGLWRGAGYFWRAGKAYQSDFTRLHEDIATERAEEEYRRLLYVGMTRAEDRLVVCGYFNEKPPKEGNWHRLVDDALRPHGTTGAETDDFFGGEILRYRVVDTAGPPPADEDVAGDADEALAPHALSGPVPPESDLPRPLSPSGTAAIIDDAPNLAASAASPVFGGEKTAPFAAARGTAIHRLLQSLPALVESDRKSAAMRYLERHGADWPEHEREAAWASVSSIFEDRSFAGVFAEGSRAEVSIAGQLTVAGQPRAVSGKIDRLLVSARGVSIVDYKTNRVVPDDIDAVPQAHVAQLALYRALLQRIYPSRPVRAGLLFTKGPRLIDIPESVMDKALELLAVS